MAQEGLKDFAIEWVVFGLLFISLMSFATLFMYNNNEDGLGSSADKFNKFSTNVTSSLIEVEGDSNDLLNISVQNDPEVSDQGSKDSVATSYNIVSVAKKQMNSFKLFLSWMFKSSAGEMIIAVVVGMFGLLSVAYITEWIRQGN